MPLRLSRAAALAAAALAGAGVAGAGPGEDARPAAEAFAAAFAAQDGRGACALLTEGLRRRLGATCAALFAAPTAAQQDGAARRLLRGAFEALRRAHPRAFPLPAGRLAREVAFLARDTRALVGQGPAAARGLFGDVVVVDAARTTARRVVLYAESDSGAVLRLAGGLRGRPLVAVALPARPRPAPPPPEAAVERLLADGDLVLALVSYGLPGGRLRQVLVLRAEGGTWRVDGFFHSPLDALPAPA